MSLTWRDLPIGAKGLVVIAIPVLPLILTAALYFQSEGASLRADADVERTWLTRVLVARFISLVIEAESAARGFLVSGDVALLNQMKSARAGAGAVLEDLEATTLRADQRARLPRLREAVATRMHALDAQLEASRQGGLDSPETDATGKRGTAAMHELVATIGLFQRRNIELLTTRIARVEELQRRGRVVVLMGTTAGVFGGVIAAMLFTTGISRRVRSATRAVSHLAAGEPVVPADGRQAKDEIGLLMSGTEQAARLLASRDESLRRRMEELEALTRELEAFSYSVSHDLRAPLRHIAGFAGRLQTAAGDALPEQQARYIRTIIAATGQMGRLIDDLLAFSRTTRTELRRAAVNLNDVVGDVQRHLAAGMNGRDVEWRVESLPTVYGDPALLRIVFDNLLSNALKYTGRRDHALIEIGCVPGTAGEAIIHVRDNGVGFDMQYYDKLFGVFQRLHSSDDFAGTGIGLATVRGILNRHGGRTWGEGRPGAGATFYVTLPTEETAA